MLRGGKTDCCIQNPTAKHIRESAEANSSAEHFLQYLSVISKLLDHGDQIAQR